MGEKGYKAFKEGMVCKGGKKYKENTTYEENGKDLCESMHYCENPFDVLDYYPLVNKNGDFSEFAEVEALGNVLKKNNKSASNKLHIGTKLSFKNFIKTCIDFTLEKTKIDQKTATIVGINTIDDSVQISSSEDDEQISSSGNLTQIGSSGNYVQINSSGEYAQIGSSGDFAKISSSGGLAKIGSSGNHAQIGSSGNAVRIGASGICTKIGVSGDYAQISSSGNHAKIGISGKCAQIGVSGDDVKIGSLGDRARISSSGYNTQIGASGDSVKIDSSGDYSQINLSGEYAQISLSGKYAQITASGENSIICCTGLNSKARAKKGSWITLSEWRFSKEKGDVIPVCVKTEYVDGERIKEDTFYKLINGEFKEIKYNKMKNWGEACKK